jgi:uncharacterized protein with von Willebrand factor type A (vWA) domain
MSEDRYPGWRYSPWDGSQEINPFDADALMEQMSDELLEEGDIWRALRRMQQWGAQGPNGERIEGLQQMMERVREQRKTRQRAYNMDSVMDDIRQKLAQIVEAERTGIQRRVDEARAESQQGQQGQQSDQPDFSKMLEKMAQRKQDFLNQLPQDVPGQIQQLSDYEFMDTDARQQFQELLDMLKQQVMQAQFQGIQQSIKDMTPEDLAAIREMVKDLNQMLQQRASGIEPDFQSFKEKHGHFFPPEINSLDELMQYLQEQRARMQAMLNSMSAEQRAELQQMMDQLLQDDRLAWDLAQMGAYLDMMMPIEADGYRFSGSQSLSLDQAMDLMGQLQGMDRLEEQMREAQYTGDLGEIDADQVADLLGPDMKNRLDQLQSLTKTLEEAGYIEKKGDRYELTPRGIRRIGQKALHDIFAQLRKDRFGNHAAQKRGVGGERTDDTKRYEFGDPFMLDLKKTIMNGVERVGKGSPIALAPEDFEVYRTELMTQSSTVLMVDMSRSMVLRGCFAAAKKVALALNSLIRGQFPRDNLYIIGFSASAIELKADQLPSLAWNDFAQGTNLQHGLILARQMLGRHKTANKQIIVITDGEPTAHYEPNDPPGSRPVFDYPPSPRTEQLTLQEVNRCTRDGIVINTFMLEQSPYLTNFVQRMSKLNKGRAFYVSPDNLGEYIMIDYVNSKTKRVRG